MGMQCRKVFLVFAVVVNIFQIILEVIVIPFQTYCEYNIKIPDNPAINMSMHCWIQVGLFMGVILFLITCLYAKYAISINDFKTALLVLIYFIYNLFNFIWSILGIIIYNDYYGYAFFMNLGFYSELFCSSSITICMGVGCCVVCRKAKGEEGQEKLIESGVQNSEGGRKEKEELGDERNSFSEERAHSLSGTNQQGQTTSFEGINNSLVRE